MDEIVGNDESIEGGEGRRDVLKKIVIGGAVAWTAPVVLSNAAWAAPGTPTPTTDTSVPVVCIGNGDWNCGDPFVICGDQGLDGICICEVDTEGNDICWGNFPCADPRAVACVDNSDCVLPGWACATTCCGTTCSPPCDGTFTGAPAVVGGRTVKTGARR